MSCSTLCRCVRVWVSQRIGAAPPAPGAVVAAPPAAGAVVAAPPAAGAVGAAPPAAGAIDAAPPAAYAAGAVVAAHRTCVSYKELAVIVRQPCNSASRKIAMFIGKERLEAVMNLSSNCVAQIVDLNTVPNGEEVGVPQLSLTMHSP
eukprot:6212240-Pleurochrysis_carterae.AAC.1